MILPLSPTRSNDIDIDSQKKCLFHLLSLLLLLQNLLLLSLLLLLRELLQQHFELLMLLVELLLLLLELLLLLLELLLQLFLVLMVLLFLGFTSGSWCEMLARRLVPLSHNIETATSSRTRRHAPQGNVCNSSS